MPEGALRLSYLIAVGIAVGLLIGLVVEWFERRIDDGPIEIVVSILTPYAVYLAAGSLQRLRGACGGRLRTLPQPQQFAVFFATVRMQAWAVWDSLTFAINGLVFVLIGLQLPHVLAGIHEYRFSQLLLYGALFSAIDHPAAIGVDLPRRLYRLFHSQRILHQQIPFPTVRQIFVVGWTGMRGVVALAAALALPETLADGSPFPQRNLIVFLTFCVILVTLVLQGLTLPALIRALGLAGKPADEGEEEEARRIIASTALTHLQGARESDVPDFDPVYDEISQRYAQRLAALSKESAPSGVMNSKQLDRHRSLLVELLRVERKTAVRLRNDGRINDEVLRKIEHELDLSETRLELS